MADNNHLCRSHDEADLQLSVESGLWATQPHNEVSLALVFLKRLVTGAYGVLVLARPSTSLQDRQGGLPCVQCQRKWRMVRLRSNEWTHCLRFLVQELSTILGIVRPSVDRRFCVVGFSVGTVPNDSGRLGRTKLVPSPSSRPLLSFRTSPRPNLALADDSLDGAPVSFVLVRSASRRIVPLEAPERDRRRGEARDGTRARANGFRHFVEPALARRSRGSSSQGRDVRQWCTQESSCPRRSCSSWQPPRRDPSSRHGDG